MEICSILKVVRENDMEQQKVRQHWLDDAKAVAILFVLLAHAEVRIPIVSSIAVLFYVPAFFVASGYLYETRRESYGQYGKRRARRLLIPYGGYSLFLWGAYCLKSLFGAEDVLKEVGWSLFGVLYARNYMYAPADGGRILMHVWNSPLWFLPALFLSEMLFAAICRVTKEKKSKVAAALLLLLVIGLILSNRLPVLLPWSIENIFLLTGLLGIGFFLRRVHWSEHAKRSRAILLLLLVCTLLCAWLNGPINPSVGEWGNSVLAGLVGAGSASILLFAFCYRMERKKAASRLYATLLQGLNRIGQSTLPIMGLHLFVFMWIQAGVNLLLPDAFGQRGLMGDLLRIMMVMVTIALITIGNERRTSNIRSKGYFAKKF